MMKKIYIGRLVLAAAFFVATLLYFIIGEAGAPEAIGRLKRLHMMPLYLAETAGVTIVWLLISLVWGRIYCSTVCPIGTLQDLMLRLRRRIPRLDKPFRYRRARKMRHHILLIYIICVCASVAIFPLVIEPWFMTGNICTLFGSHVMTSVWSRYGFSAIWGILSGTLSLIVLLPWALLRGREFCNTICPLGTAMGYMSRYSAFQIMFDPDKCISCMKCEDNCRSNCIKVISRYVDNQRCVRCMECVAKCPADAIRYSQQQHRPLSPLFSPRRQAKS